MILIERDPTAPSGTRVTPAGRLILIFCGAVVLGWIGLILLAIGLLIGDLT